jgi:leucyl-tRNA synthetase
MSKSKFNGLNPVVLVNKFGADALRMALFFAAPPDHDINFHEDLLVGADRFLKRVEKSHVALQVSSPNAKVDEHTLQQRIQSTFSKYPNSSLTIRKIIVKLEEAI